MQLSRQIVPPCASDRTTRGDATVQRKRHQGRWPRRCASPTRGPLTVGSNARSAFSSPAIATTSAETHAARRHDCPGMRYIQPAQARRRRPPVRPVLPSSSKQLTRPVHGPLGPGTMRCRRRRGLALHEVTSLSSGSLRPRARDRWLRLASHDSRDVRCAGPEPRGRSPGRAGEAPCRLCARPAIAPLRRRLRRCARRLGHPSASVSDRVPAPDERQATRAGSRQHIVRPRLLESPAPSMGWPVHEAAHGSVTANPTDEEVLLQSLL